MSNLFRSLTRAEPDRIVSIDEVASYFTFNGVQYGLGLDMTMPRDGQEEISPQFLDITRRAYKRSGAVFACVLVRMLLFSEARFAWNRQGQDLFTTDALAPLQEPWPNATTRNLLARMEQDLSLAGNFFGVLRPGPNHQYIKRMRPDWVTIVSASRNVPDDPEADDLDAEVIGYAFHPGGRYSGSDPVFYTVEEVAHYAPVPDPEASWRGMSWLQSIITEVRADKAATEHKLKFFENGATPNLVVVADARAKEGTVEKIKKAIQEKNEGLANAYKTLVLGGGADAKVVGSNLQQLDFKSTQGAGETRIAAAAGVPPILAGFSEGLTSATYSNYGQALRRFADGTLRPLWGAAAGSLGTIISKTAGNFPVGSSAELWYDDRHIPFLQEDVKDRAIIQASAAATIRQFVDGGFTPESAVAAVMADDLGRLEHTGMFSVQLHPPGTAMPTAASSNGAVPTRALDEYTDQLIALSGPKEG